MNEKIKNFFCIIGGAIAGFVSTIIGIFLHNRRTTDRTGESIKSAKRINRDTKDTVERLKRTNSDTKSDVEQLTNRNNRIGDSVESSRNIIEEIKKQKLD